MSRYSIPARLEIYEVVVGWDNPLSTYFAQVFDRTKDEDDDHHCVLWLGAELGEIRTVNDLMEAVARYVDIPPDIVWRLYLDRMNGREPTSLQRRMRQLLADDNA